jgi:hypothetical protein
MADKSKLRTKIKPVVLAVSSSAILVAGLVSNCGSGNLLPPDMDIYDLGLPEVEGTFQDEDVQSPDVMELPADDVSDKEDEDTNDGPGEAEPNPEPK